MWRILLLGSCIGLVLLGCKASSDPGGEPALDEVVARTIAQGTSKYSINLNLGSVFFEAEGVIDFESDAGTQVVQANAELFRGPPGTMQVLAESRLVDSTLFSRQMTSQGVFTDWEASSAGASDLLGTRSGTPATDEAGSHKPGESFRDALHALLGDLTAYEADGWTSVRSTKVFRFVATTEPAPGETASAFYVDRDGRLRRVEYPARAHNGRIELEIFDFGTNVEVKAPK